MNKRKILKMIIDIVELLMNKKMASDENENHDPTNGQFASGGGSSGGTNISRAALKTKLESTSHERLIAASNNPKIDPKVKKLIDAELDSRANRGTSKGFGEQ